MKHRLYAILDTAAANYLPPFMAPNDAVAIRNFQTCVMDENHEFCKHAEDFSMWAIGTYETQNAEIETEQLRCVAKAHEIKYSLNLSAE